MLWATLGALAAIVIGYCVSLLGGTAVSGWGSNQRAINFAEWLTWDISQTLAWLVVGAGAGAVLSFILKSKPTN